MKPNNVENMTKSWIHKHSGPFFANCTLIAKTLPISFNHVCCECEQLESHKIAQTNGWFTVAPIPMAICWPSNSPDKRTACDQNPTPRKAQKTPIGTRPQKCMEISGLRIQAPQLFAVGTQLHHKREGILIALDLKCTDCSSLGSWLKSQLQVLFWFHLTTRLSMRQWNACLENFNWDFCVEMSFLFHTCVLFLTHYPCNSRWVGMSNQEN